MEPSYKIAAPRRDVREGWSLNSDEFAVHPEQVIAKTTSADYREPGFLCVADALSALYPRGSEENRLLDAMLLAVPR